MTRRLTAVKLKRRQKKTGWRKRSSLCEHQGHGYSDSRRLPQRLWDYTEKCEIRWTPAASTSCLPMRAGQPCLHGKASHRESIIAALTTPPPAYVRAALLSSNYSVLLLISTFQVQGVCSVPIKLFCYYRISAMCVHFHTPSKQQRCVFVFLWYKKTPAFWQKIWSEKLLQWHSI
mgnify:CR=1 FL=1